jgi:hypothetical protein
MGHHVMIDTLTIAVRIADMRLSNTSAKAPDFQKNKAFELFDIIEAVIKNLHGWTGTPEEYGRLQRTAQHATRKDAIRIYEITFQCKMINAVAKRIGVQVADYDPNITAT